MVVEVVAADWAGHGFGPRVDRGLLEVARDPQIVHDHWEAGAIHSGPENPKVLETKDRTIRPNRTPVKWRPQSHDEGPISWKVGVIFDRRRVLNPQGGHIWHLGVAKSVVWLSPPARRQCHDLWHPGTEWRPEWR